MYLFVKSTQSHRAKLTTQLATTTATTTTTGFRSPRRRNQVLKRRRKPLKTPEQIAVSSKLKVIKKKVSFANNGKMETDRNRNNRAEDIDTQSSRSTSNDSDNHSNRNNQTGINHESQARNQSVIDSIDNLLDNAMLKERYFL